MTATGPQALNNLLVLPNIMNINWGDPSNDDSISWKNAPPRARALQARRQRRGESAASADSKSEPLRTPPPPHRPV
jgi:hypothetical protein